jgi:hypothetical protein
LRNALRTQGKSGASRWLRLARIHLALLGPLTTLIGLPIGLAFERV